MIKMVVVKVVVAVAVAERWLNLTRTEEAAAFPDLVYSFDHRF